MKISLLKPITIFFLILLTITGAFGQAAPTTFTGSATGTTISLTYNASVSGTVAGLVILARRTPGGTFPTLVNSDEEDLSDNAARADLPNTADTYTGFTGAVAGAQYDFEIYAYRTGPLDFSNTPRSLTVYTLATAPGAYPGSFALSSGGTTTQVNLTFTKASRAPMNAHGYAVLRHAGSNPASGLVNGTAPSGTDFLGVVTDSTATTYADLTAVAGTSYTYALVPYRVGFNAGVPIAGTYSFGAISTFTTAARTVSATVAQQSGGVSNAVIAGENDKALIGFNFTSTGTQNVTGAVLTFSMDTATLKLKNFELVESNDATFDAGDAVIASHANGKLVGTSSTIITLNTLTAVTGKWYFLRADVDLTASANTFSIDLTSTTVSTGVVSNSSPYFTHSGITITPIQATFSSAYTGTSDPLTAGDNDRGVTGFSFTSNGSQTTTGAVFTFSTDTATLKLKNFELVQSADNTYDAGDVVIASHANGKLVGTSTTVLTISGITATVGNYYFLRADVDGTATANTFTLALTSATVSTGGISNSSPYFTKSAIDIAPQTATFSSAYTGTSDPLTAGDNDRGVTGFSFTSTGSQTTTGAVFTFSTDTATLKLKNFELVQSADNTFDAGDVVIASHANGKLVGTSATVLTISGITATVGNYYFLRADVDGTATASTFTLALTSATVSTGGISNSSPYFTKSAIDIAPLTATFSSAYTGTSDPLLAGDNDRGVTGFSFTSTGSQTTTGAVFTFSTDTATLKLKNFELVQSTDNTFDAGDVVIASHANGKLVGTSATVLTISGITATVGNYYFLRADIDGTATANTFTLALTSATVSTGGISNSSPYFTKAAIDIAPLTATFAIANGGTSDPVIGGENDRAIIGFNFTSTGVQNLTGATLTFGTDTATLALKNFELVQSADNTFDAGDVVIASHANGKLIGTSSTVLTISGLTGSVSNYYFLRADVDPAAPTSVFTLALTSATVSTGSITNTPTYFTKSNIDITALNLAIGNLNTPTTNVAAEPLTGGDTGKGIFGFSLTSNGTQVVSTVKIRFDADPASFYNTFSFAESANALYDGGDATVPLTSSNVVDLSGVGTGPWEMTIDPVTDLTVTTIRRFFLVANVNLNVTTATDAIQATLVTAGVAVVTGNKSGSATGVDYNFAGLTTSLNQLLTGISASPLNAGSVGSGNPTPTNGILGFSITTNGTQSVSLIKVRLNADPAGKFTTFNLVESTDNSFTTTAGQGTPIPGTYAVVDDGGGLFHIDIDPTTDLSFNNTTRYFFLIGTVNGGANTTSGTIQASLSSSDITITPSNLAATSLVGDTYSFAPSNATVIALNTPAGSNGVTANIGFGTYSTQTAPSGLTGANSTSLAAFRIRDGGGSADLDTQGTTITNLQFTITEPGDLNTIALFTGATLGTVSPLAGSERPIGSGVINYSGLTLTAPDNGDLFIVVRTTFKSLPGSLGDANTHEVTITAATASTNGSALSATPLTSATTGSGALINNLNIVATKLIFNTVPAETPPFPATFEAIVHATDASNNIDIDVTDPVAITKTPASGTLTGGSAISPVAGVYTFSALGINLAGNYTLDADDPNGGTGNVMTSATSPITIKSLGPEITSANLASCHVGDSKYYVQLDTLIMRERDPADFNVGSNRTFLLFLPDGWEYLTPATASPTPNYSAPQISRSTASGSDFSTNPQFINFIGNTVARFSWTVTGTSKIDTLMIRGLYVKNSTGAKTDSLLRSGTAVIEGVDETVNIGTLSTSSEFPVSFTVLNESGPGVDPNQTKFSLTEPSIFLRGKVGSKTFQPDTLTFSGNGVSLKTISGIKQYIFNPSAVSDGFYPITMVYKDTLTTCLSDTTRIFEVYDKGIQGLDDEFCKNDAIAHTLTVNPGDIPAGYSIDLVTPFKYQDPRFNTSRQLNPYTDMIFYQGGSAISWPPTPVYTPITSIIWNPINPSTGRHYSINYSYPGIWDTEQFYGGPCFCAQSGPVNNLAPGFNYFFGTTFVQLQMTNHGLADGDKLYVTSPLPGYLNKKGMIFGFIGISSEFGIDTSYPYTVTYVDANNVIINLYEAITGVASKDGVDINGYVYTKMPTPEPYNITTQATRNLNTYIDIKIPGHTFANGDQVYINDDYYDNFGNPIDKYDLFNSPKTDGGQLTVEYRDANTIRVDLKELPSAPTNIKIKYPDAFVNLFFDGWLTFPGNHFDISAGFPYKGVVRGTSQKDEFLATNFEADWIPTEVSITAILVDVDGRKIQEPKAKTTLLNPPTANFDNLTDRYCTNSTQITLTSTSTNDGIYSAVPSFGLANLAPGSNQANFTPSTVGVLVNDTTKVTFTVTDAKGCINSLTKWTIVHSLPVVDANPNVDNLIDVEVCQGTPVTIGGTPSAQAAAGAPYPYIFSHTWTVGGVTVSDLPNPDVNPSTNQLYTLTVKELNFGCENTAQVTVNSFVPPTAIAGTGAPICSSERVELSTLGASFSNATTAEWSAPNGGLFKDALGNNISTPYTLGAAIFYVPSTSEAPTSSTGTIRLVLTTNDPTGPCPAGTDEVLITSNPSPAAPIVTQISPVCVDAPAPTLIAIGNGGSIKWYDDKNRLNLVRTGSGVSSGISMAKDTVVHFYGTQTDAGTGCESLADSVRILINPNPVASFNRAKVCLADFTEFTDGSTLAPYLVPGESGAINKWAWDFDDGSSLLANNTTPPTLPGHPPLTTGTTPLPPNTHPVNPGPIYISKGTYQDPMHQYQFIGNKNVKLTVTTDDGCSNTATVAIRIGAKPTVNFSYKDVCETDGTVLTGTVTGTTSVEDPISWSWDFDDAGATSNTAVTTRTFTTFGEYDVQLIATTNLNCADTINKRVFILPYLTDFSSPYVESFEGTNHGWVHEGLAKDVNVGGTVINDSWNLTSALPVTAFEGSRAWVTSPNGISYLNSERSVLYGPCINVAALPRPALSFAYWSELLSGDGVYVEVFNEVSGLWEALGITQPGLNWYNESSIAGLTNQPNLVYGGTVGQSQNQKGFSGDSGWKTAVTSLDEYGTKTKLQLRFVFGTDGQNTTTSTPRGFMLDNVKLTSRNRQVLVENFTSTAIVAADNNTNFNDFKSDVVNSEVIKMQYHTNLAGTDLINEENPVDPGARVAFYGVTNTSMPRVYIDGYSEGSFTGGTTWGDDRFSTQTLVSSPLRISVKTIPTTEPGIMIIADTLFALENMTAGKKYIVHTAIVEKDMIGNQYVIRKMLPSAAGREFIVPAGFSGNVYHAMGQLTWRADTSLIDADPSDLAVICFVQDQITKEILQSSINLTPHVPGKITDTEDDEYVKRISLYPNPANNRDVTLELPGPVSKPTNLLMYDTYGRIVYTGDLRTGEYKKSIATAGLAEGVYLIQITTPGGAMATKKLMVTHR